MATERLRAFKGVTELKYANIILDKSDDTVVDAAEMEIEANSVVTANDVISFKEQTATTTHFSAKVLEIIEEQLWTVRMFTNGYELNNKRVQKVYTSQSPEDIVKDLVDNFTDNLTYASTATSGQTITKYIANGYLIDVIEDMMKLLDWQLRINASDSVFFEPKGNINNGKVFTTGTKFRVTDWSSDSSQQFNKVQVKGAIINHQTQESFTGTGAQTAFVLAHKPVGIVKIFVNAVEQVPDVLGQGPYDVDAENKTINFKTAPPNTHPITVDYSFALPVVVEQQDDPSITKFGEIFRDIPAPFIDNFTDARNYASNLIQVFAFPLVKARGFSADLDFTRDVGEIVRVIDNERVRDETLVIRRIIYDAAEDKTFYEFGSREFVFFDWQKEVEDRIKELEKRVQDIDSIAIARLFSHNLSIALNESFPLKQNSPKDSFILGHETLGLLRVDLNEEPDASTSATNHNGTWNGTGIGGAQYTFLDHFANLVSYWPMDEGDGTTISDQKGANNGTTSGTPTWGNGKFGRTLQFDGTDDFVDFTDDTDFEFVASNFTLEAWIKIDTLASSDEDYTIFSKFNTTGNQREFKWYVATSDDKVKLATSNLGSAILTATSNTALAANTWYHLVVVKSSTTATFYLNGVADGSGTVDGTLFAGTAKAYMAATEQEATTPDSLLDGFIDNVRVYNAAINAEQVKTLYNLTRASQGKDMLRLSYGSFNGTDNYVTVPDHADLDLSGDLSISIGVKVSALPSAERWLVQKYDGTNGYAIRINASNQVELFYSSASTTTTINTNTTLVVDKFQHVTFTKTGTTLLAYIDGVQVNTGTGNTSAVGTNASALEIGRRSTTFFAGDIDEVRIYNDLLTPTEVLNIYNKISVTGNLQAYWAFDNPKLGDRSTQKREVPNP